MNTFVVKAPLAIVLLLVSAIAFPADSSLVQLAEKRQVDAALALINAGTDVNAVSADGTTALHWAAYYGELSLAERLLRAEANPDVRNDYV